VKCSWNTHFCGTLHLDKGVTNEIKEKLQYLKKGQTAYCRKGPVLVNVWRDKRDVQLISTLHNTDCGDKKEQEGWNDEEARNNSRL